MSNDLKSTWSWQIQVHFDGPMMFDFVFDFVLMDMSRKFLVCKILGCVPDLWVLLGPPPSPLLDLPSSFSWIVLFPIDSPSLLRVPKDRPSFTKWPPPPQKSWREMTLNRGHNSTRPPSRQEQSEVGDRGRREKKKRNLERQIKTKSDIFSDRRTEMFHMFFKRRIFLKSPFSSRTSSSSSSLTSSELMSSRKSFVNVGCIIWPAFLRSSCRSNYSDVYV